MNKIVYFFNKPLALYCLLGVIYWFIFIIHLKSIYYKMENN
ncbi:MAG: hypothetical protein RI894_1108 [Bacteroidota bacterium]